MMEIAGSVWLPSNPEYCVYGIPLLLESGYVALSSLNVSLWPKHLDQTLTLGYAYQLEDVSWKLIPRVVARRPNGGISFYGSPKSRSYTFTQLGGRSFWTSRQDVSSLARELHVCTGGSFLAILTNNCSDAVLVDATMNALSFLIRSRPTTSNKILNAVLNFNPLKQANSPMTPKIRVAVKSMEKTTRMLLIHIVKRYACSQHDLELLTKC